MQCLNFLNPKADLPKDISNIRSISVKIEKKLSASDVKIDKLTLEELQDINKIVGLANFMLCKYEDKKETRLILQHFVSIIGESAQSMENVDDDISELILSAEDSINKVKNMHSKISEKSDLKKSYLDDSDDESKNGSINLTNFTTPFNTSKYQEKSQGDTVQVI
ncbi:MAG: hypothetical protein COV65_01590 [Nitrosopumilales archaeon CG11_big_fil_rev_8_21_14_0_20_33_24]|jgi:hypothetical protein|nr:MAG: hypothetical protein COV65_01590 [Nitrosopumilales archaeon CG11_big_fil_rev_8_21_14_0_20_33_24]PIY88260.1 MAG: hypothetical protein COY74_09140 [Nitrosopumilales archaeon CG_4_10_14_0_8_um_filter_34_8]